MLEVVTDKPAFVVVCRSGGDYTLEHAECMRRQFLAFNTDPDFQFYCLTDTPTKPWHVPLQTDWPGWWAVQETWRFTGPTIQTGLDTLICGPLTPFTDLAKKSYHGMVWGIEDWYGPRWANAVQIWKGDYRAISNDLDPATLTVGEMEHTSAQMGKLGMMLGYMDRHITGIISYKKHVANGGPASEKGAKVVCWHGQPRPWDDRCKNTWAGKLYRQFMNDPAPATPPPERIESVNAWLCPDSKHPMEKRYHIAWDALLNSPHRYSPSCRAHAKVWLTYRAVEGSVQLHDWLDKVAKVDTGFIENARIRTRWETSLTAAEIYLAILFGEPLAIDRAKVFVEAAENALALWPAAATNVARIGAIVAYWHFMREERTTALNYAAKTLNAWRGSWAKLDIDQHPLRFAELPADAAPMHAITRIIKAARGDATVFPPWAESLFAKEAKTPWWRCMEQVSKRPQALW